MRRVTAVIVAMLTVGCSGVPADEPTAAGTGPVQVGMKTEPPRPKETPAPDARPVTMSAVGNQETDVFRLDGVDYTIEVDTDSDCFYGFSLYPERSTDVESFEITEAGHFESTVEGMPVHDYKLKVITGDDCGWEVTFAPQ